MAKQSESEFVFVMVQIGDRNVSGEDDAHRVRHVLEDLLATDGVRRVFHVAAPTAVRVLEEFDHAERVVVVVNNTRAATGPTRDAALAAAKPRKGDTVDVYAGRWFDEGRRQWFDEGPARRHRGVRGEAPAAPAGWPLDTKTAHNDGRPFVWWDDHMRLGREAPERGRFHGDCGCQVSNDTAVANAVMARGSRMAPDAKVAGPFYFPASHQFLIPVCDLHMVLAVELAAGRP